MYNDIFYEPPLLEPLYSYVNIFFFIRITYEYFNKALQQLHPS